ncbi:MAG: DUF998 domain-containing protein [Acidimicrobiia bacterium]
MIKLKKAGFKIAAAGVITFLGIQLAEVNYVGNYSTKSNYISDLGINNSFASFAFNVTMMTSGILIYLGNRTLAKNNFSNWLTITLRLYAIGTFLVGLFPSTIGIGHGLGATLVFFFGAPSAFTSIKYFSRPFKSMAIILGSMSTLFLINFMVTTSTNNGIENIGGIERFLIYPITMWLIIFGTYICSNADKVKE